MTLLSHIIIVVIDYYSQNTVKIYVKQHCTSHNCKCMIVY